MEEDKTCKKCNHEYQDPSGAKPGVFPCLEIVACAEDPGSTICGCREAFHSKEFFKKLVELPRPNDPPGCRLYDFKPGKKAVRIDSTETFLVNLDLSKFVKKLGATFVCSECDEVLVRIEPGGVLGEALNQLDTTVILDHHLAKHNPKETGEVVMHVNNSEQWTEYDRPGSQWFISLHQDGQHAVINCRRQMQGLGIPVEAAKAIIEACKLEGHPETPPLVETVTKAWAVIRKDGQIQHLDGGLAKRLAVFRTKEDAEHDCDKKDEVVVPVLVLARLR